MLLSTTGVVLKCPYLFRDSLCGKLSWRDGWGEFVIHMSTLV